MLRGNGTNVIRIVPYSATQFAAYEKYKRVRISIINGNLGSKSYRRMLSVVELIL